MRSPSDGLDVLDELIEKALWRHVEAFLPNDTPLQAGEAAGGTQDFFTKHRESIM